jgi:TetR/AcrR family transcriptional repressor of nem operon
MKPLHTASQANKPGRPTSSSGKELIIWQSFQVFREKGYHHTTMADLGQASGLLKGSIYHYFESKEELMRQVLQAAHLKFKEDVFALAYQKEIPAKACLRQMFDKMDIYFFEKPGGCLMGNIGLETAGRETSFTKVIHGFFEEWREVFTYLFGSQYTSNQAKHLARQALSDIQGAIMLSCIFKDKSYYSATVEKILRLLP